MEKVLVYEDGNINEYELNYDQLYMNICLDEYKRNFSILRNCSFYCSKEDLNECLKNIEQYYDETILFSISSSDEEVSCLQVVFTGIINPVVYNILSNKDKNFSLDNIKISAIVAWCQSLELKRNQQRLKDKKYIDDYFGYNEEINVRNNITDLFEGVSLNYIGRYNSSEEHEFSLSKRVAQFVDMFRINKNKPKQLKK